MKNRTFPQRRFILPKTQKIIHILTQNKVPQLARVPFAYVSEYLLNTLNGLEDKVRNPKKETG